ncbi:hypothetical protein FOMA001_g14880 [Fusarium oxysporum f. sp. matthiolae]|nr:hypothetical protein FOMA001_g14880 [Fusarium oxysporum f. sp. matthiolae]
MLRHRLLQYTYAIRLLVREGQGPIPFWMQTFYVAHELTLVYLFAEAAPRYDYHWFFVSTSFSLAVWAVLEIFCMWYTIQSPKDRIATFSPLFGKQPATSSILTYTFFLQLAMFALVWILIEFLGAGSFMLTGALTNVLLIIGPTHEYLSRGSRNGLSIGFCLTNVACAIWTFAPFSLGAAVLPEIFDQPIMYVAGIIYNLAGVFGMVDDCGRVLPSQDSYEGTADANLVGSSQIWKGFQYVSP